MKITRRQILAAAAAVPVVGGLAAGTTAWRWYDRPAKQGLKALSEEEYDFVQSMAEAWMPPGGVPALSGSDADLGAFFDDCVDAMTDQTGRELKLLLHALDALTVLTHLGHFQTLPLATRTAVLTGWMDSPVYLIRDAVAGVMVLMGVGWTTHPDVVHLFKPFYRCGYGR